MKFQLYVRVQKSSSNLTSNYHSLSTFLLSPSHFPTSDITMLCPVCFSLAVWRRSTGYTCISMSGLFHLESWPPGLFIFLPLEGFHWFILAEQNSVVHTCHIFSIHASEESHHVLFCLLVIVNIAETFTVQTSLWYNNFLSFGFVPVVRLLYYMTVLIFSF